MLSVLIAVTSVTDSCFRIVINPLCARSLLCFRAVTELGMSIRQVVNRLEMSPPGVGFSVERGKAIADENGYRLIN